MQADVGGVSKDPYFLICGETFIMFFAISFCILPEKDILSDALPKRVEETWCPQMARSAIDSVYPPVNKHIT